MVALLACLVLPLRVYAAGDDGYAEHMAWFKRWLLVPTAVYFVAGTYWQMQRMQRRA